MMTFNELEKRYGVTKHTDLGEQLVAIIPEYKKVYVSEMEMSYGRKNKKSVHFRINIDPDFLTVAVNARQVSEIRETVEMAAISAVRQVLDQL